MVVDTLKTTKHNTMKKQLLIFLTLFSVAGSINAQVEKQKEMPSVGLGAGITTFFGDYKHGADVSAFSRIRGGYNLTVEQRIGNLIGVSLNGVYGKIADSEIGKTRNLNFQSQIIQADLNLVLHLDNNFIFKRGAIFAPYIYAGFGYMMFDSYTDLKDKNGKAYFYWTDGTIRDISETDTGTANIIHRDYKYESKLVDSTTNYPRNTFAIPIGGGVKLQVSEKLSISLGGTYYLTMTDWIDNVKQGGNDRYFYGSVSLHYQFGKAYDDSDPIYKKVDFASLDKMDTDGDGIADGNDRCPGTPKGVKVDSKGCPEDADQDGVPDYRDKEPLTKKGALVDENGVTLTDKIIEERQARFDSLATERSQLFNENPSLAFLKDIESKSLENRRTSSVPSKFRAADKNNDGYISADEITQAIDSFFEGDSDFTAERLNELIDYFFEQ